MIEKYELSKETIASRDALLKEWLDEARRAEAADKACFKVPAGEGLAYNLARSIMCQKFFPVADMPPEHDYYRLDIPVRTL